MLKLIKKKLFLIKAIFWLIAIILGLLQAWSNRYSVSTGDAISYLDIGEAYFQGDWQQAVNGYFSPLYSLLLGLSVSVLNPSSYWQFFVVKLVNFTIYLLSLVAFELLLSEFINYYNIKLSNNTNTQKSSLIIPNWIWYVSGYILFLWSALKWIGIDNDTPDMCVATLVYLAAWLVLRVYARSDHWFNFIGLGVVLGLGYLSKAIMFPMAFIFLGTCFFSVGNIRRSLPRISVAFLVFALISTPFIAAISQANGYLTFGTAGKFNYAWNISPGGIEPEEKIAILGRYGVGHSYYWARLAQVKIIAEIPNLQKFWQSNDSTRSQVYKVLEEAGAKVLVEEPGVNSPLDYRSIQGWQKLKNADCYLYFLSPENSDRRDFK
ncbi:MAG: hypothetical protein RIM23_25680 [Coleofasciculus sp. G3-WIS-01]|uniref:glycosyltransferase family 39 protein n=1 Tax=Coleofasciculus sp. G3-WIS-01 TaxID=3069528 RepID=UPI0032F9EB88